MSEQSEKRRYLSLELWMDIEHCNHALETAEEPGEIQFYRRTYVRAAFAYIEGTMADFRLGVLNAHKRGDTPPFSASELALLEDQEYALNEKGEFILRRAKVGLPALIRFSVRSLITAKKVVYQPNYSGTGWNSLKSSSGYRDQLMHPKSLADIEISDKQLEEVRTAVTWLYHEVNAMTQHFVARGAIGDAEYDKMIEERQATARA